MPDLLGSTTKHVSFKCRDCEGAAKIVEVDDGIDRVFCPSCGSTVDGEDARSMYHELRLRYVRQESSNVLRRELRKRRVGSVPLRKVGNEFADPRWPFILMLNDNG